MTQIGRSYPIPTPVQRIRRTESASGSDFHAEDQAREEEAQPRFTASEPRRERRDPGQSEARARTATAGLMVQLLAGKPRRGLRAEASERDRYTRAYAQPVSAAPRPILEKVA